MRSSKNIADRFWSKVDKRGPDECWEWRAGLERTGYGRLSGGRRTEVQILAHRYSYQLHIGPIPDGKLVCHTCDNRKCVNPAHLWAGTCADNHHDRNTKGRQAKGERQGSSKLTSGDVVAIRQMRLVGLSLSELAAMFAVSKNNIKNIAERRTWAHI